MKKKHTIGLLLLIFALTLLATGCAHKGTTPSRAALTDPPPRSSQPMAADDGGQLAPESGRQDDFADDLLEDEFEDEFQERKVRVADPLSSWNRAMFHFNDKLYFWLLKPLARAYKAVTPDNFRSGVKNFFSNITFPIRLVNCILQGKGARAEIELERFILNTCVGVLGAASPADNFPRLTPPDEEDLGQTLGIYGFGNGFYIIWPLIGPSTLRDTVGRAGDWFLNPINYIDPAEASLAASGLDKVNQISFRIGEYEAFKKAAIDPYVALRDIYLQLREQQVKK